MNNINKWLVNHRPAVIAGTTAIILIAGITLLVTHQSNEPTKSKESSSATTSSKLDVKVKNIIIQPKQTNSASSSKAPAQQIELDNNLHTNLSSNPTSKPKDTPPSGTNQKQEQHKSVASVIPVQSIETQDNIKIAKGESYGINIEIKPLTATNKDVTWTSSDSHIATVDKTGLVTGVSSGNCTITVTSSTINTVSSKIDVAVVAEKN